MKISRLMQYLQASQDRWGDLECYIDLDPENEELFGLEYVFCDMSTDTKIQTKAIVFAAYGVQGDLKLVK